MVSKSNTLQFIVRKMSTSLDPSPNPYRKVLSNNICKENIQKTSSLFVPQVTLNNCHSKQSTQIRWSTNSLDDEIKKLLNEKLVRQVVGGRPFDTLQFHRRKLINQLRDWIGVFYEDEDSTRDENSNFRHELVSLLATALKQNLKDIPLENSEWTKLLNKWLRANTSGTVISSREIYRILAVDGFRGFKPNHLKCYLPDILLPLRMEYKSHVRAIRNMYQFFDENENVSSLTGTDSACVIFLSLIDWYALQMKNDLMLDDQIMFKVHEAKSWAEGCLQQHGEYYRDVKNVDEKLLKKFGIIYAEQFKEDESWKVIGRELLTNLNNE